MGAQCGCKVTIFHIICIECDIHMGIRVQHGCKVLTSNSICIGSDIHGILGLNVDIKFTTFKQNPNFLVSFRVILSI